jgi:hypothetical protein
MNNKEQKVETRTEPAIVGNTVLAEVPDHGMCMEQNCKDKATIDYNGHGHWVCKYHYDKLSDYFDEEYC